MSLLSALTNAILPVLAVAAVGFLLGTVRDIEVSALGTVTIYVLNPALVFYSLTTSSLDGGTVATLAAGVLVFTVGMVVVAELVGRALGETEPVLGALVLTSAFPNAGNYGIPLSQFAFHDVGRSTAILYIAMQSVLTYTLGVYVASRGDETSSLAALREVFKLPLVYAVLAAGLVRFLGLVPPTDSAVMSTLNLTGNAAIPVMLLMLGIQLANTDSGAAIARVGVSNALKLVVAPALAVGIVFLLGFQDVTVARVFVLECAMPAAVTPLILTIEYNRGASGITGPEYVSTAIFVSTLLSVPVLTVLIAILQSGAVV
ncbi:permease [Haladaptatus sp. R4]|uniref:AEC family transporter n=1 Tax=Haladaptatus sp. R4 TaxID=1679489 RepID=UPI0007B4E691|nr:AEC family transporter [Haladaptatus sp. R4]KZN25413.1 permease [Haladaptatus sp. R4]